VSANLIVVVRYVDVWKRSAAARAEFSGWALFSQCANAEPAKAREMPSRVRNAERIMTDTGYKIGPTTKLDARTWFKSTPSAQPCEPPATRVRTSAHQTTFHIGPTPRANFPSAGNDSCVVGSHSVSESGVVGPGGAELGGGVGDEGGVVADQFRAKVVGRENG
jgi:hypothetical protein